MNGFTRKLATLFIAFAFALSLIPLNAISAFAAATSTSSSATVQGSSSSTTAQKQQKSTSSSSRSSSSASSKSANSHSASSSSSTAVQQLRAGYVYVDTVDIEEGRTQNVVISIDDNSAKVSSAKLTYSNHKGKKVTVTASKVSGPAMLFEIDVLGAGSYELLNVTGMLDSNKRFDVDLKLGQTEEYTFNAVEASSSLSAMSTDASRSASTSSASDVSIYAMDDSGSLLKASSINEAASMSRAASGNSSAGSFVIALNPGHGGPDSGAVGPTGLKEADVNWKIAQYCKTELEKYSGVSVFITRKENEKPGLSERAQRAKDAGAQVYVSLHINSAGSTAKGAEVWYPNDSSYNYAAHEKGKELADKILVQLESLGLTNRGGKTLNTANGSKYPDGSLADYYTDISSSRRLGMPGIIVEHAFISNPSEEAKLKDNAFLKKLAAADATGIAQAYGLTKGGRQEQTNGKLRFLNSDGSIIKSAWHKSGNLWYYLDSDGYAVTGFKTINNKRYYFDSSCVMKTGWQKIGGKWYFFDKSSGSEEGAMKTGWLTDGKKKYYLDSSGVMKTGWQKVDGKWYRFDSSGAMQTGWLKLGGTWYYLNPTSGAMATGHFKVGTVSYYCGGADDGAMKTGWAKDNGTWYYFSASGARQTGWRWLGAWYYLDPSTGAMATGHVKVSSTHYFFGGANDGSMKTGWAKDNGTWYYFSASGARQTGWRWLGAWYYLDPSTGAMATGHTKVGSSHYYLGGANDGAMKTGWAKDNGTWYYFSASGARQTGWRWLGAWYYLVPSTGAMATGHAKVGSSYYYFGGANDGAMKTGWVRADGKWYYFNGSGAKLSGWQNIGARYYLDPSTGAMATGWQKMNNQWRYFGGKNDGAMKTGWAWVDGKWYYLDSSGIMKTGWLKLGDVWYYLEGSGAMVTGQHDVDGKWYYFSSSGAWMGEGSPIMGTPKVSVSTMVKGYQKSGRTYPAEALGKGGASSIETFCQMIYEEAVAEGVRPEVVWAQIMNETGFLQFGGDVKVEQFNFGGIGATGNGAPGNSFPNVRTGIRAQVQHLKCYASTDPLKKETVDPRWYNSLRGTAKTVQQLGGKWATNDKYGEMLVNQYMVAYLGVH